MWRRLVALGVVLASTPAFAQEEPPSVYVELSEAGPGDALARASATTEAVAHVLVGAGMPVRLGRARRDCGAACVHVTVRRDAQERFVIEARYLGRNLETTLPLPASASIFDRSHALAVEIELLVQAALESHAARAAAAPPPPPPRQPPEEVALERSATPPPDPGRDAAAVSTGLGGDLPFPAASSTAPGAAPAAAALQASAPRREHVAFQADAITLGTAGGGLISFGLALALRVPLGDRYDVRLGVALLDADREVDGVKRFWRKLNPVSLYGTVAPDFAPWLRLGAGVEGVAMVGDDLDEHHEPVLAWSYGAVAHAEARLPIRSFTARLGVAAAYHPFDERLDEGEQVLMEYPRWTVGASLGLEFRLF